MGNSSCCSVLCLGLLAACGGEEDKYLPPGGNLVDARPGSDAPLIDAPLLDAAPDAGPDAPMAGVAPVITLLDPMAGTIVRGMLRVEVDVVDADGIAAVQATVGNLTVAFTKLMGTRWQGVLDTTMLAGLVSPTIVVRATDHVGAMGQLGFQIILDNVPPLASLDPPNVRVINAATAPGECSLDFDPLGGDAPNDGESVPQLIELRARITDVGNTGTLNSTLYIPNAGVASAVLYVFDDTTKPLVVDTNADGVCDAINPQIVPATMPMLANEAAVVALAGITPTGDATFGATTFGGGNATSCVAGMPTAPPALCLGESSTIVIDTPFTDQTQVFGVPPIDGFNCLGFAFDARATNISDGWACAATVVTDQVGNRSVSAPLRICIDSDGNRAECSAWGTTTTANRPNCTGTVSAGVVNNTPCTPRTFPSTGTANDYELIFP
ncbi:MAG: hypothetical protein H0T46_31360 [Deltaproteobacteria bacterium]|nr:hypothetical protein [Deltaproteobacteria bacterium]